MYGLKQDKKNDITGSNKPNLEKDLHDQDNHDGVITDLEPDILELLQRPP